MLPHEAVCLCMQVAAVQVVSDHDHWVLLSVARVHLTNVSSTVLPSLVRWSIL